MRTHFVHHTKLQLGVSGYMCSNVPQSVFVCAHFHMYLVSV